MVPSDRLTVEDWTTAGLKALVTDGAGALKADRLAKALKVSRGSFYWHFADVEAFHAAVLERWRDVAYANIVIEVEAQGAEDRLSALIDRALQGDTRLERAVRAWATAEAAPRAIVADVDERRLDYLRRLVEASGVAPAAAATRVRVIYWTYLGRVLSGSALSSKERAAVVADLLRMARS